MKKQNSVINKIILLLCLGAIALITVNPALGKEGASKGLLLCGRVIIPTLFPFTVCILYVVKSGFLDPLSVLTPIIRKLFSLNGECFGLFVLSLVAGYPVGAKILSEAVKTGRISEKTASNMLPFCINAGPGFIMGAVGQGIFNSKRLGIMLFAAHIFSSFFLCFLGGLFCDFEPSPPKKIANALNPIDSFVLCVAEASASVMGICGYVILFSALNPYVEFLGERFSFLKILPFILEATNGITETHNIYLVSFILGFSGICVWLQVISNSKNFKINYFIFTVFRILHGLLSIGFCFAMLKIFKISIPTFSLGGAEGELLVSTPQVAASMLVLGIVFVVSLTSKKSCKLSEDIL